MKFIIDRAEYIFGTVVIAIGTCAVVLAFFNSPVQLQIVVGLAGLGFISLGLLQLKRARDKKEDAEKLERIYAKLDEIRQLLDKEEKPGGSGVVIADVLGAGLKYYTEHMNKDKDKE